MSREILLDIIKDVFSSDDYREKFFLLAQDETEILINNPRRLLRNYSQESLNILETKHDSEQNYQQVKKEPIIQQIQKEQLYIQSTPRLGLTLENRELKLDPRIYGYLQNIGRMDQIDTWVQYDKKIQQMVYYKKFDQLIQFQNQKIFYQKLKIVNVTCNSKQMVIKFMGGICTLNEYLIEHQRSLLLIHEKNLFLIFYTIVCHILNLFQINILHGNINSRNIIINQDHSISFINYSTSGNYPSFKQSKQQIQFHINEGPLKLQHELYNAALCFTNYINHSFSQKEVGSRYTVLQQYLDKFLKIEKLDEQIFKELNNFYVSSGLTQLNDEYQILDKIQNLRQQSESEMFRNMALGSNRDHIEMLKDEIKFCQKFGLFKRGVSILQETKKIMNIQSVQSNSQSPKQNNQSQLKNVKDISQNNNKLQTSPTQVENDTELQFHQLSLQVFEILGRETQEFCIQCVDNYANYLFINQKIQESLQLYKKSTNLKIKFYQNQYQYFIIKNIFTLGKLYTKLKKYQEAYLCYVQALQMNEDIYQRNTLDTYLILLNLGDLMTLGLQMVKASIYYSLAFKICVQLNGLIHPDSADVLIKIGKERESKQEELEKYQNALQILNKYYQGKHQSQAIVLNLIGKCYSDSDLDEAIKYYYQAVQILQATKKDQYELIEIYSNIGQIYKEKKDIQQALNYYADALKIIIALKVEGNDLFKCHNEMSLCFMQLSQYEQAISHIEKAIKYSQGQEEDEIAIMYNNCAIANDKLGILDEGYKYHQLSLQLKKKIYGDSHPNVIKQLTRLSINLYQQNKFEQAISYLQQTLDLQANTDQKKSIQAQIDTIKQKQQEFNKN